MKIEKAIVIIYLKLLIRINFALTYILKSFQYNFIDLLDYFILSKMNVEDWALKLKIG